MRDYKNDIFGFFAYAKRLAICWICFGALGVSAIAADSRDVFNHLYNQSGQPGYDVYGPASTSRALVVSNATLEADGSSSLKVNRSFTAKNPSGIGVDLMRTSYVRAGHIAAGIYGAYKILTPLGVAAVAGSALYDVAKELSFDFGANAPDGSLTVTKSDPTVCTVAPCYQYGASTPWSSVSGKSSPEAACNAAFVIASAAHPTWGLAFVSITGAGGASGSCVGRDGQGYPVSGSWGRVTVAPSASSSSPSSVQELTDAIASKSGWPTTSRIAEAVLEAARITGKPPEEVPENNPDGSPNTGPDAPSVTGPSSSSGGPPEVSTTSKPDGSTERTTKTVTHNHTYQGATVTTTTVTNNMVESCTGAGSCVTTTTTSTKTPTRDDQSECEKNPDSIGCKTLDDVPDDEVPKDEKEITWAAEELGLGGGSCPGPWDFQTSNGQFSLDIAPYCGVLTTYVKPVVIALALLAALFIVAPIRTGA